MTTPTNQFMVKDTPIEKDTLYREYVRNVIEETLQQRENQILKALEERGFKFENRIELEEFAKTRCQVLRFQNLKRILTVDGNPVCEWWETSRFENNGNTFTCIVGEPAA